MRADARPVPSNRITVGCIGLGMEGMHKNLRNMLAQDDAQVVAVCDVDASRVAEGAKRVGSHYAKASSNGAFTGVTAYADFRELLARRDIDAVVVSTPDHWHVPISILAVRAGKDVMCEKPLTRTIAEGRQLADEVERYARVFQTASEFRATPVFHRTAELVRNGRLGRLHTIRTWLPSGNNVLGTPSFEHTAPPKGFDYDMWLGPAPVAPYFEGRCHFNFRWLLDYSGGHITDWGCHLNDIAQWANGTDHSGPTKVRATGVFPESGPYNTPVKFNIEYTYANGVRLVCADGQPGIRFEGDRGQIHIDYGAKMQCTPASLEHEVIKPHEIRLYTDASEHRNFLNCVKTRKACYYPAEVGHRTATLCHLGVIALRMGRGLEWDPVGERIVGDEDANRYLGRANRAPWNV